MGKTKKDLSPLDPLRRALYDAIQSKGVSEAELSRAVRGNGYFINKYLWGNNPQELSLDDGIKAAEKLCINPAIILGERYNSLTNSVDTRVIHSESSAGTQIAENDEMGIHYDVAVEALSKLSATEIVRAVSDATDLAAQRDKKANPRKREITS